MIGSISEEIMIEWSRKYKSDVIALNFKPLPMQPIVWLNSYDAIKEAMLSPINADITAGRPKRSLIFPPDGKPAGRH